MIRPEIVPLLVVALLLIAAQPGVESITTVVGGEQDLPEGVDAIVLVDGTVTIPEDRTAPSSLYVVGGSARVNGTLDGRLVQLAGAVSVAETGAVTGRYQQYGGVLNAAAGAAVEPEVITEPLTGDDPAGSSAGGFALQLIALAAVSFVLGRRYPSLLSNVGETIRQHPVVSGTVGLLSIVTLLALFVFMAFTIILIPVSLLGMLGGLVVFLYAYVCVGFLVGRLVPGDRPGVSTALGAVAFLLVSRLVGFVPVVGESLPFLVLVVAVGAVLITYFGLRVFEPPALTPVE